MHEYAKSVADAFEVCSNMLFVRMGSEMGFGSRAILSEANRGTLCLQENRVVCVSAKHRFVCL